MKNEQIVLAFQQLIGHHVVQFVVLDVVDFHVVEWLICLIWFQLIAVELLDLCFGIKFLHMKSKKNIFFYSIVVVLVQVIFIHPIKHVTNLRNRQEIIFGRQYISISFGEENLMLFRFFVSVNCSCLFCTLFLYHCCGKLKEMIKIAKKLLFFSNNLFIQQRLIDFFFF